MIKRENTGFPAKTRKKKKAEQTRSASFWALLGSTTALTSKVFSRLRAFSRPPVITAVVVVPNYFGTVHAL